MNNRQKIMLAVLNLGNKSLDSEIVWYMECEHEDHYDIADAFDDVFDLAVDHGRRYLIRLCYQVMIEAGYLVEQPIKPTSCRDMRITFNKIKYDYVSGWSAWIEE